MLEYCLERGLILIGCGLERNVIRFLPPLTVTGAELDQGLSILTEAIGELS